MKIKLRKILKENGFEITSSKIYTGGSKTIIKIK